jgi:trk system potassium uptake protein TrkA
MKMKKDIAVIGLGTFGYEIALQLAKNGHHVLAIDTDEKKINQIKDDVDVALVADITDPDVLKKIQIEQFDSVILAMSSNLESIILAITHMKKMGVSRIIGKANTPIQKEILLKIGADEVILPEVATAVRLADKITHPDILEKFYVGGNNALMEVVVPEKFYGKSLKDLDLRKKYGVNVIMISRNGETEVVANPELKFAENAVIFVVGNEAQLKKTFFK